MQYDHYSTNQGDNTMKTKNPFISPAGNCLQCMLATDYCTCVARQYWSGPAPIANPEGDLMGAWIVRAANKYGPIVARFQSDGRDKCEVYIRRVNGIRLIAAGAYDRYKVGDKFVVDAGAPGTGRWTYQVTAVTPDGLYGFELSNTVRELTIAEVK